MSDNLTAKQRSYCMSRVKDKNTYLEKVAFSVLRKQGIRFKKHVKNLPGKPDIVIQDLKTILFVDGDFWHGYRFPTWQKALPDFWKQKIAKNRVRDKKNFARLRQQGWKVIRVWGHELKSEPTVVIKKLQKYF